MSRKIRGIVFDLEGTIVSVEECHTGGFSAAALSYGIEITPQELLEIPGYVGAGDKRAIDMILEKFRRADVDAEEFRIRKMERYNELLNVADIALRPGFADFCCQASRHWLQIAIASLTPRVQANPLIKRIGLEQLVPIERIVLREDVTNVKPNPEVFLEAAARINVHPRSVLVFGDSVHDMTAAVAAGSVPIGMPCNFRDPFIGDLLKAGAVDVFKDWRSIRLEGLLEIVQGL